MFDERTAACRDLDCEPGVRVVIITGAGRGFCAGLDLDAVGALVDMSPPVFLRGQEKWASVSLALRRLAIPVMQR